MTIFHSKYPNLVKPLKLGRDSKVSNRMYFSSVGFDLCDHDGRPMPEFYEVYESIMDGGCGFGFLGNASVDASSQYTDRSQKLISDEHALDLEPVFKAARDRGFLLSAQLQHYGSGDATSLSEAQIESYINHFHDAAKLALKVGAPALQIHAANGYLLSSFLSPKLNRRVDRWGGTPMNRARILLEVIRRVKQTVQDEMIIFIRLQIDDGYAEHGLQVEQLDEVIVAIEEAGADAVTCANGVAETFGKFLNDADYTLEVCRHAGRFLKQRTAMPIGFSANISSLSVAEEIIASGDADFVGFGRPIIADHQFVNKALSGQLENINHCRWDSFCLRDKKEPLADRVFCCVNPSYLRPQHIQDKYQEK
ncbi:NADH:flavin oxidoreductase [Pseudoalteromonas citrea]|uniref:NADH:flavin oxidoreductase n=1 Tax=Pseudoalteromonas citrea TaxID=43655 RepID=A0A5S3XMK9_9GAMM|nr:NADH:flavin oxidoreductase [Pseudoalteromonas citrea]TMP39175.1 NADH:flavin oxidoreductase [Pseudoalteromonas citrea]TMP57160.1 NADH:flavin oxidoreductase [Pseudoalteromonas citrea]